MFPPNHYENGGGGGGVVLVFTLHGRVAFDVRREDVAGVVAVVDQNMRILSVPVFLFCFLTRLFCLFFVLPTQRVTHTSVIYS